MAQTWVQKKDDKKGDDAAHLVKFFMPTCFEAACGAIIARSSFLRVKLKRVSLLRYPYYSYQPDALKVCKTCQSKAD